MSRTCTICSHAQRAGIDAGLLGAEANRRIAARYGVSEQALRRHRMGHLGPAVAVAAAEQQLTIGGLLRDLVALQARALELLSKAERRKDLRAALGGVREARACIELASKMLETSDLEARVVELERRAGG